MLVENQIVEIKLSKVNLEWYNSKGYKGNLTDVIRVKAEDLSLGNGNEVLIQCDYCLEEGKETIYSRQFFRYIKDINGEYITKNACNDCQQKRREETNWIKYGAKNAFQNKDVQNKAKNTSLERYGTEYPQQSEEVKDKIKEYNMNNYGVEYYFQTEDFKDKYKDIMIDKYGVDNSFKAEEVKDKIKATNLDRYGFEYATQSEEIKQKMLNTNQEKYGVDNYAQSDEFKERYKSIMNDKYGVNHYSQTEEFNEKIRSTSLERYGEKHFLMNREIQDRCISTNIINHNGLHHTQTNKFAELCKITNMEKYGVEWSMQNKEIKERAMYTMYLNNSAPCSRQQRYLHNLLGGELNYQFGRLFIDIAMLEDNLAIEYDGGFHNGQVKLGKMSQDEFDKKERTRGYFLRRNDWKLIKIISRNDFVPSDDVIIDIINYVKEYLNTGHSWFEICIDEGKLKCSQYEIDYDFGKLRKITEKDLEEVV